MSSETPTTQELKIIKGRYVKEEEEYQAPSLCYGSKNDDECREIYFVKLKKLGTVYVDEWRNENPVKSVTIYYYENPMMPDGEDIELSKIPKKGIVLEEIDRWYDDEHNTIVKLDIKLHFLPVLFSL